MSISRRDFVVRAGQLGGALYVGGELLRGDLFASPLDAKPTAPDVGALASSLQWRMLGPFRGGRVAAATGVPGRPNEFYFGAVNGGVWKTYDAGRTWNPIFDSQPVASIGAIAVAPSAPDTIYVGSGESTPRDSAGYGDGMYKSTDGGKTWTHIGLENTQHIGKIAVDPRNPNVVFVAAIGHLYAPNPDRGVFRSRDGGRSWQRVLFKNDDVGAVEVVIDPKNSRAVYAGLWNTRRPPWFTYAPTNGPGGGIYKSTDGGTTWRQLTNGLPKSGIGRTGIAVAPSNSRRVYAVVDCLVPDVPAMPEPPLGTPPSNQPPPGQGGFFRSDDAGATWTRVSNDNALWGRGWYFEKVTVDPRNADIIYVPNIAVNRSKDGGRSWAVLRGSPGGDDYHQAWINPDDTNIMIVASDQGAVITHNAKADDPRTVTWSSWLNQPTAQLYHISVDYRVPYWVTGAQQDSGAVAVRSRGKFDEIAIRDWEPIGSGGESGYTAGDPLNPGIVFGGTGQRFDLETNLAVHGTTTPQLPPGETARTDWTQPLVVSKADPHALYYANQYVYKSSDAAKTWTQVSPDLTRPVPGIPATLDATARDHVDRNGKRGVVYTIAPSPLSAPTIWVGTDDGLIHLTIDDGKTWTEVSPPELVSWCRVTMIDASHFDANTAYASVDRHQLQDFDPYIYRTRDGGKSWQRITRGLPRGVYVHTVKEDPTRRGLLFAGTERGAFVSLDDGENWQSLQLDLPVTSVRDFEIYDNDLIVGTHGRGIWVIDDITPLRQISDSVLAEDAYLFKPQDILNLQQGGDNGTPFQKDEAQAPNRPAGVAIDFYLRSELSSPVTLDIVDATGATVRAFTSAVLPGAAPLPQRTGLPTISPLWQQSPTLPLSTTAGFHRVWWEPVVVSGGGRRGAGGGGGGVFGRSVTPLSGTFTVRLNTGAKVVTQTFTVRPDPRAR